MHKVVSGRCSKFPAVRRLQERIPARSRFTDPIRSALILSIDLLASFNPLPVTPSSPIGRAVLEQRPIWVHSLEETAQSFATFVPILREQKTSALAAVPITRAGSIVGCIGWSFEQPQAFAESQRGLLMQIAQEHSRTLALGS